MATPVLHRGRALCRTHGLMPTLATVGRMSSPVLSGVSGSRNIGTTRSGLTRMLPLLFCHPTIWCWKWFPQVSWLVLSICLLRSTKCPMARVNTDRRSRCLQCPDQHGFYQNCKELPKFKEEPKVPGVKDREVDKQVHKRNQRASNPGSEMLKLLSFCSREITLPQA